MHSDLSSSTHQIHNQDKTMVLLHIYSNHGWFGSGNIILYKGFIDGDDIDVSLRISNLYMF